MWRSLRTLRSFPRLKDIALILGKHGFHQVASTIRAPLSTRLRRFFKSEPPHVIHQPERLRLALEELGPTFIKFGQFLSTRPDLLPAEYIEELSKLQDNVQPAPFGEIRSVIEKSFQVDLSTLFRTIHPEPLASASIAQVHRAVTVSGEDVVLKVRKRGLVRVVRQDLQVLGLLAEVLVEWQGMRLFDPQGIVRVFERTLQRELNLDYERNNLLRMREILAGDASIYVPRVFPDLSNCEVLTMEYLVGEKLTQLRSHRPDPETGKRLATNIALSILKQVFEHGIFHADPHPGNFILMPDGRVGMIDFGNVGRLPREMVDDLLLLCVALLSRNFQQVARWILKMGRPSTAINADQLSVELMETLDPYYGLELEEIQIGGLFNSLFGMALRYGISIPSQYVAVGRALTTLEGTVRLACPGLEIVSALKPYMTEVFQRRWSLAGVLRDVRAEATDILGALRSYPMHLAEILGRAAEGRLSMETRVPEVPGLGKKLEHSLGRLQAAVLVCGLLVSSALLLSKPQVDSLPQYLGVSGFVCGLLLVLKLVLRW